MNNTYHSNLATYRKVKRDTNYTLFIKEEVKIAGPMKEAKLGTFCDSTYFKIRFILK